MKRICIALSDSRRALHLYTERGLDCVYGRVSKGQSNHGFRERAEMIHGIEIGMVKRKVFWAAICRDLIVSAISEIEMTDSVQLFPLAA